MSHDADKQQDDQPKPAGDSHQIDHVSGGVVAMSRGAVATAVYQGLTTEEVAGLFHALRQGKLNKSETWLLGSM